MGSNDLLYVGTNSVTATAYIGILRAVASVDLGSSVLTALFTGSAGDD